MSRLSKKITYVFLILFTVIGCKKITVAPTENYEVSLIKAYAHEKLTTIEYNSVNWDEMNKTNLSDGTNAYQFKLKNNGMSYFTGFCKSGKIINAQLFKSSFENSIFSYEVINLISGSTKSKLLTIPEILKQNNTTITPPNPPGGGTLPLVIVYGYLPSNSTTYSFTIFVVGEAMGSGGNQNGQGVVETFQPDETGGGAALAQFATLAEALEFAIFMESLNAEETALLALFPYLAIPYYNNSKTALAQTQAWAASQCPGSTTIACQAALLNNGKADAIRHAYWSALNKSDMGQTLAKALGDAHEHGATKPASMSQALWDLQKTMDLNNNLVGRDFPYTLASGETIWDKLIESVNTGGMYTLGLVYLCDIGGPGTESLKLFSQSCP